MLSRLINSSLTPHILIAIGTILVIFKVPFGGFVFYMGLLVAGIYFLIKELRDKNEIKIYYKVILILIPILIVVMAINGLLVGTNYFLAAMLLLFMHI